MRIACVLGEFPVLSETPFLNQLTERRYDIERLNDRLITLFRQVAPPAA